MNQLKGLDASFLYAETRRMPMHIGSVQILDVPAERRDCFFAEMKQSIRSRSHLLRYLTHRIEDAPLRIDHPSWVECETDFDTHIERIVLPAGGVSDLERAVAELHARPLDRSRPLWKIYYIEGLEGGHVAYFNVIHHACLDGVAGQAAVDVLTDATPNAIVTADSTLAQVPIASREAPISLLDRWVSAGVESIARGARGIDAFARLGRRLLTTAPSTPPTWFAPPTSINRAIGCARDYALLRISLTDVKAIGKAHGCSVNDVFLTICAGALRAYLLRDDALPDAPMVAGVPMSLRRPDDKTMNTQVTMMRVLLGTQIADPIARLAAVRASALDARTLAQDLAAVLPSNPRFPGAPWFINAASRLWELSDAVNYSPPLVNLVISNVPGPRAMRFSNGARMLTHFPVSIPAHGTGVNITVQSYAEHLDIGFTACAATVRNLAQLRDDLLRAYIDLRAIVLNRPFDVRALRRDPPHAAAERRCLPEHLKVA